MHYFFFFYYYYYFNTTLNIQQTYYYTLRKAYTHVHDVRKTQQMQSSCVRSRTMFPRSSLVRLPWFEKQKIHMVLRDGFQVVSLLRGPNPQRKFLSFRATPEVNFSALSPIHNVLPSRCPSPNKSAPRDIIVARVSAKGARCREVASLHVPIGQGCDRSKERE